MFNAAGLTAGATLTTAASAATLTTATTIAALTIPTSRADPMSTFSVADTAPDFTATLTSDGTPVNLTGATVEVRFMKPSGVALHKAGTIGTPLLGTVTYTWVTGDLSEPGSWSWEVRVTYASGRIQTFIGPQFYVSPQAA